MNSKHTFNKGQIFIIMNGNDWSLMQATENITISPGEDFRPEECKQFLINNKKGIEINILSLPIFTNPKDSYV